MTSSETLIKKAVFKAKMPWRRFWLWLSWKHDYKCIIEDKHGRKHEYVFNYRWCLGKYSMWINFEDWNPTIGWANYTGEV